MPIAMTFHVDDAVHAGIRKRAATMNMQPSAYARQLLDAAYAARLGQERAMEPTDAALDRQVRQVFLLADCEPEFIAGALGVPAERVARIVEGWKKALGMEPAPALSLPPPVEPAGDLEFVRPDVQAMGPYSDAEKAVIDRMWAAGDPVKAIGQALNRSEGALSMFLSKNRDRWPRRRG